MLMQYIVISIHNFFAWNDILLNKINKTTDAPQFEMNYYTSLDYMEILFNWTSFRHTV